MNEIVKLIAASVRWSLEAWSYRTELQAVKGHVHANAKQKTKLQYTLNASEKTINAVKTLNIDKNTDWQCEINDIAKVKKPEGFICCQYKGVYPKSTRAYSWKEPQTCKNNGTRLGVDYKIVDNKFCE